jgi:hypothetical protein
MYSTPEERSTSDPTRHRYHESCSPPTIEQIAMGLHVSRTPHLRPVRRASPELPRPLHTIPHSAPLMPPPPPFRSSLKNSSTQTSTITTPGLSAASVSTLASTTPSTPHSARSISSFKSRMTRFFPGMGREEALNHLAAAQKEYKGRESPKKAVRFSGSSERE